MYLLQKQRNEKKIVRCRYCETDVATKNFVRHLQRNHAEEESIRTIMAMPKNSIERRNALALLRYETNFDLYIHGETRPSRQPTRNCEEIKYYPCAYCKGLFMKSYIRRHAKACRVRQSVSGSKEKTNHLSNSQTVIACALDPTNVISKLNIKEQVFTYL